MTDLGTPSVLSPDEADRVLRLPNLVHRLATKLALLVVYIVLGSLALKRALRHRDLRLFLLGQGISLIGTWMQQVAIGWLVYRLTGSAFLLGLVGFVAQGPGFVLAPFAGELADRYSRHRIVIITQMVMMAQALVLGTLVLTDNARHADLGQTELV